MQEAPSLVCRPRKRVEKGRKFVNHRVVVRCVVTGDAEDLCCSVSCGSVVLD